MTRLGIVTLLAFALGSPPPAEQNAKHKKPRLDLRATPRMALSPVTVHLTAELLNGEDLEDWYCPEIEWDWDDGGRSIQESDCPPFTEGTKIDRRYSSEHVYPKAGVYQIKVTLRHRSQTLGVATARVTIRQGASDMGDER